MNKETKEAQEEELRKKERMEKFGREFCGLIFASKSSDESDKMKEKLDEIKKYSNSFILSDEIDYEKILEHLNM